jgi:hypothetical protein
VAEPTYQQGSNPTAQKIITHSITFICNIRQEYICPKIFQSDFPILYRPIYPLNIAYLNHNNLQLQETKLSIAKAVDSTMTVHGKDKGINFISKTNAPVDDYEYHLLQLDQGRGIIIEKDLIVMTLNDTVRQALIVHM